MSAEHELLRANDLRFLAVARGLSDRDWSRRSLCSEWTNHDVLAHLVVGCQVSAGTVVLEMFRHRGSFERSNAKLARSLAARTDTGRAHRRFRSVDRSTTRLGPGFSAATPVGRSRDPRARHRPALGLGADSRPERAGRCSANAGARAQSVRSRGGARPWAALARDGRRLDLRSRRALRIRRGRSPGFGVVRTFVGARTDSPVTASHCCATAGDVTRRRGCPTAASTRQSRPARRRPRSRCAARSGRAARRSHRHRRSTASSSGAMPPSGPTTSISDAACAKLRSVNGPSAASCSARTTPPDEVTSPIRVTSAAVDSTPSTDGM